MESGVADELACSCYAYQWDNDASARAFNASVQRTTGYKPFDSIIWRQRRVKIRSHLSTACLKSKRSLCVEMSESASGGGSVSHVSSSSSSSALAVSDEQDDHLQFITSEDHAAGSRAPGHAALFHGRSVLEDSVDGKADGISMSDEACENKAEVQSCFLAVEEAGNYDPENQSSVDGDNWSETSSYSESRAENAVAN